MPRADYSCIRPEIRETINTMVYGTTAPPPLGPNIGMCIRDGMTSEQAHAALDAFGRDT